MTRKTVSTITDTELTALYDLLEARGPAADPLATFSVPLAQPKERHRKGGAGHMYTPENTVAAEEAIGWAFKAAARNHQPDKGRYGLHITVAGANAATDVDNLEKLVMDGLQGQVYKNDRQVDELYIRRLPGRVRRTEVTVYRIEEG
ncbi:MAG TPA: RusA family crossover junction endodeoxyribonuclease [Glycomyces sp.]|nr:RusA family crossover junction endodeoxyribonuclease [Glycomyces sp.]